MFRFYIVISRFRQLFIVPGWMLNRSRILSELRCSSDGILENRRTLWIVGAILMRKGRGSEKSEGALVDG